MSKVSNPIKHVKFSMQDYINPTPPSGGSSAPLKEVTQDFREHLIDSLNEIKEQLSTKHLTGLEYCAAIVELEENAIAKSHRPTSLFNEQTCPFFGDAGYGKMLIQASATGIERLSRQIAELQTKSGIKALSTIKSISKYEAKVEAPLDEQAIIVRLFRYPQPELNRTIDEKFEKILVDLKCDWEKHKSESVRLYKVWSNAKILISILPDLTIVQSAVISNNISIQPVNAQGVTEEAADILAPDPLVEYPVVGVVDSGVSNNCLPLNGWVVRYISKIPTAYRDVNHGTFVSGIVSNPYLYNKDERFPKSQAKVVSVEVLGKDIGDMYDIVQSMYETAEMHPEIRVWNLSLGAPQAASMTEISAMALMLDEFQDKYHCLCVIAAGNFTQELRKWPPEKKLDDGVSSPGDSVRGLTIGSIAHIDGLVKNEEPSPFSRKGPVSNYVQKPDLVHFGGNSIVSGGLSIPVGVNSVCPSGLKRNDVGTSYATPVISNIAANVFQQLGSRATPNLVKALIVHNANMNFGYNIGEEHRPYFGWGLPGDITSMFEVHDYETTLVFEGHAQKSFEVEKLPFPIPDCLRTSKGKVRGEFFITLVYQPDLDPNRAFEYCQVDVKVGLGKIKNGSFTSKVPPKNESHLFESDLVKNGDKWSPVKVYQQKFSNGVDIADWRLRVKILDRDGYEAEGVQVPFTIILTIRDIDKEKPVYNEMIKLMNDYNWEVSDLVIDQRIPLQN